MRMGIPVIVELARRARMRPCDHDPPIGARCTTATSCSSAPSSPRRTTRRRRPCASPSSAEASGYDLVTFQDHPYQPRFHDTSTLLTWVAARTERIHLAANVANLPLRPPAVLARAAASLDLLSRRPLRARARRRRLLGRDRGHGRPAAHARPGGRRAVRGDRHHPRRLGPGRARRGSRSTATYYRVNGAKRGPAPAHNIPIWIGALQAADAAPHRAQGRRLAALARRT